MHKLLRYCFILSVICGTMTLAGGDSPTPMQTFPGLQGSEVQNTTANGPSGRDHNSLDQGGDNCGAATTISSVPYYDTGTTAGRANDWNTGSACAGVGGSNAPDVIYRYTPSATGTFVISTCGSLFNTLLEVRSGTICPGTTQVACAEYGCGGNAEAVVSLTGGTTYWIIVDGHGSASGFYTLRITAMCNVVQHAGDLVECAETPDSSHARLDCNGGPCKIPFGGTASYTDISCGQSFFGHSFTYSRVGTYYNDYDWFHFSATELCSVRISVEAEFPSTISAGTYLTDCSTHPQVAVGRTCEAYTLIVPNVSPGDYEFTLSPRDNAGLSTVRNYRVTLTCTPVNLCHADTAITAPGTITGNTCDLTSHCTLRDSPEKIVQVTLPDADNWTFSLCSSPLSWSQVLYVSSRCCGLGDTSFWTSKGCGDWAGYPPLASCQALPAGIYYVTIEGNSASDCGDFTLDVHRCRQRCCYGEPDLQSCQDITKTACLALGGIFDDHRSCSTDPCPVIPACLPDAAISQRPAGVGDSYEYSWLSDLSTPYRHYDRIYGVGQTVAALRFWGVQSGTPDIPCQLDPMVFTIAFYADSLARPGALISSFDAVLSATRGDVHSQWWGDTLYEYNVALPAPMILDTVWLGIFGTGSGDCQFRWFCSRQGDGSSYLSRADTAYTSLSLFDMAFCLGSCLPPEQLTIQVMAVDTFRLSFIAPLETVYRFYYSPDVNANYPTGYFEIYHALFTAGPNNQWFVSQSLQARFVIIADCGATVSESALSRPAAIVRIE